MSIREPLLEINTRISDACHKAGRDISSVRLVAVSKTRPVGDILEAVNAGQLAFGENYAQELRDKSKELTPFSIEWHFIGHLQKNKLKYVLPVAKWIHTIDSMELLEAILNKAKDLRQQSSGEPSSIGHQNDMLNCLIEVNIAGEGSKTGISPENVLDLVERFSTYKLNNLETSQLALKGLMCMPPVSDDPEASRPYFQKLKNLLDEINSRNIYPERLTELSMGMTQDFEVAIEEGATMVRIGSAIFGERNS